MSLDERNQHPLVYALRLRNSGLADDAMRLIQRSEPFIEYTISTFSVGTDHTKRHTRTVEKIGHMILSDSFLGFLTDHELFFFVVSCHYHDLAMAGAEADDRTPESRDQVRRDHAVRIGDIIRKKWVELGFENSRVADILGEICRGHRPNKNPDGVATWAELNRFEVLEPGVAVRTRLLSAMIYAIDELHIGADRAPERVQNWRNIQDEESRRHWRRHQAVIGPVRLPQESLLFQVLADTPALEDYLRSQVLRKAFLAINDLRRQANEDGVTASLPVVTIQWERRTMWELFLIAVCLDMVPRSREEISREILDRFAAETAGKAGLKEVCAESGNAEHELASSVGRVITDAIVKSHLVPSPEPSANYILSAQIDHAEEFFRRARVADEIDLLFVGRYRRSMEQELFSSQFGRCHIRNHIFPIVERAYSVALAQRSSTDPLRVLLEQLPTAARLVRDFAPITSNLVKEPLLTQAVITGSLIDLHADPNHLLDESIRHAIHMLSTNNTTVRPTLRLLEELALVGGFTHEQIVAASCASDAAQESLADEISTGSRSISIRMSQSLPKSVGGSTHLSHLLLASHRAGTSIFITSTTDHDFNWTVEGDIPSPHPPTTGLMVGIGPSEQRPPASIFLPARVEVSRSTRTIRLYLGQFSVNAPSDYPVVVRIPFASAGAHPEATVSTSIQWPEMTVRDLHVLDMANQAIQDDHIRIELILEQDKQLLGSMTSPQGDRLFNLVDRALSLHRALRDVDETLPIPLLMQQESLAEISSMTSEARRSRWHAEQASSELTPRRIGSAFLRLTTVDGRPCEERFLGHVPFNLFSPPSLQDTATDTSINIARMWTEGEVDFLFTGYFGPDIYTLARELDRWFENREGPFPLSFSSGGTPDHITRSMITVRLLRQRDRHWHRDRPIIFEIRPVNRREAYEMEATYWGSMGDARRAQLAREICKRDFSHLETGIHSPAVRSEGATGAREFRTNRMTAEPHPLESDLKQLTLRAAVALATRCARRVQPILAPRGDLLEASQKAIALAEEFARGFDRLPEVSSAIASQAELFAHPPVQEPYPRDPRLDLPHAMGAAREAAKAVAGVSEDPDIPPSPGVSLPSSPPSTEDLLSHAAKAIEQAALVTAINLEGIGQSEAFRRDYVARYTQQAQETAWAAEAIQTDFETLKRLHPGTGAEFGNAIDPSDGGEIGPLWPNGTPRWFRDLQPAVRPVRLSVVVPVSAQQTPQGIRQALDHSTLTADVLCLSVGDEAVAFPTTPAALDWVKGYCSFVPPGCSPNLIVLASISSAISADEEQQARAALVYKYGAVVFSRGTGLGEFPDWIRVQSVLPTVVAMRSVGGVAAQTGSAIGLPPTKARGYGRQPAHVDDYDPVQFEKAVKRLNQAEWWEMDY